MVQPYPAAVSEQPLARREVTGWHERLGVMPSLLLLLAFPWSHGGKNATASALFVRITIYVANQFAVAPSGEHAEGRQTATRQVWGDVVPSANCPSGACPN